MDIQSAQRIVADKIAAEAQKMGIEGVATVLIVDPTQPLVCITPCMVAAGNPIKAFDPKDPENTGWNLWGGSAMKVFQMLRTFLDAGDPGCLPPYWGEHEYGGGLCGVVNDRKGSWRYFVAFSGGTVEQDLDVVLRSIEILWSLV